MKEFIQPFLDLIQKLVQPGKGTKFLVALAADGSLLYLAKMQAIAPEIAGYGIVIVTVCYFVADIYHKHKQNGGSQ